MGRILPQNTSQLHVYPSQALTHFKVARPCVISTNGQEEGGQVVSRERTSPPKKSPVLACYGFGSAKVVTTDLFSQLTD